MVIEHSIDNGNLTIKPIGRLDSSTADEFDEAIKANLNDEVSSLNFDMKEVDFISSKGVRILVSAYRIMNGRKMILTDVNESVREVLRLSGLLKIFEIAPAGEGK